MTIPLLATPFSLACRMPVCDRMGLRAVSHIVQGSVAWRAAGLFWILVASFVPTEAFAQQSAPELTRKDTVFRAATPVLAEMGHLEVPEDRDRPGSRTIRIRFLRFQALTAQPGAPIFWVAGGPGSSGTASARYQAFPLMMALRARSDVIVIDQRGTPGSTPDLRCPDPWSYPLGRVGSWDDLLESYQQGVARCATHWQGRGVDLAAYHTQANADDIEDLREALGYRRVNLFGESYGTHLALDFIRRHPGSVERAVLVGLQGLDQMIGLPEAAERQLEKIDALFQDHAAATPQLPSVTNALRALLDRLEAAPATVRIPAEPSDSTVTVTMGAFDLQLAVSQRLGHRSNVTRWLVRALRDAARGNLTRAAQAVAADRSRRINMMSLATACASGASESRRQEIAEQARTTLLGRAPAFPLLQLCDTVPHRHLGPAFRDPVRSDIPVLFVSGTLDHDAVSTARSLQRMLPNADYIILENGFHNDYIDFWPVYVNDVISFLSGARVAEAEAVLPIGFQF